MAKKTRIESKRDRKYTSPGKERYIMSNIKIRREEEGSSYKGKSKRRNIDKVVAFHQIGYYQK